MNIRTLLLLLTAAGFVLPMTQFVPWVIENGLDLPLFFQELFSTRIGGFFGLDVIVSAVVLLLFILVEGKRLGMDRLWLPIIGTLSVGVSFGLPLFLYLRQVTLEAGDS